MFEIADVVGFPSSGQEAVLDGAVIARLVSMTGMSSQWPSSAVAVTAEQQVVGSLLGSLLGSVADAQLLPTLVAAQRGAAAAHLRDLVVGDEQASSGVD